MAAIQADIGELDGEEGEKNQEMGQGLEDDEAAMLEKIEDAMHESDGDDDEYEEEKKLDTVREGNESNA